MTSIPTQERRKNEKENESDEKEEGWSLNMYEIEYTRTMMSKDLRYDVLITIYNAALHFSFCLGCVG